MTRELVENKLTEIRQRYPEDKFYWLNIANDMLLWIERELRK